MIRIVSKKYVPTHHLVGRLIPLFSCIKLLSPTDYTEIRLTGLAEYESSAMITTTQITATTPATSKRLKWELIQSVGVI